MKKRIFIIILGLLLSFGFTAGLNSLDVAAKKPKQDCTHKFKYTDYTDKKYKDGKTYTMNSLCVQHGSLNGNNALSFSDLHAKPDCYPSGLFSKPSNDVICTGVNKPGDRRFFLTVSLDKTKQTATVCLGTSYRTRTEWHAGMGGGSAPLDFPKVDSCVKELSGRVFGTAEKNLDGLEKEIDAALGEYEKKQKKKGAQAMEGELTEEKAAAENGSNEAADKTCYDGAGALGWILCPVISHAENLLNGFYERLLEPMLKIDNVLISGSDGSNNQTKQHGTRDAWMVFRDIANYIFIAFFVVVIFSQLSGYGIDNYGIKKALPRLIMVAVLVNLSFILCQLAVDVSNIVGFSIKDLLDNIADGIMSNNKANGNISGFGHFLAISIIVAMFGVVAWISDFAIILPIFLMAASGIVALLFLCLMLGARLGAVLLLVAASPIAIVCYALPNTKPLFDKWFKWFKTMLLLFPIVGLLMGGGQLASAILMASNNGQEFFLWFIAAIAGLVPIFFIPTLTRNALSAFGAIASNMAGRTAGWTRAAKSATKNSRAYQQKALQMKTGLKFNRDGSIKTDENGNAIESRAAKFKKRFGSARRSQNIARMAYGKQYERDGVFGGYSDPDLLRRQMQRADLRGQSEETEGILEDMKVNGIAGADSGKEIWSANNANDWLRKTFIDNGGPKTEAEAKQAEAVLRGLVSEKGGKGLAVELVRGAGKNAEGMALRNFFADQYKNDDIVKSKMIEGDNKVANMLGDISTHSGEARDSIASRTFDNYYDPTTDDGAEHNAAAMKMVKTFEQGLSMSGVAQAEYAASLTDEQLINVRYENDTSMLEANAIKELDKQIASRGLSRPTMKVEMNGPNNPPSNSGNRTYDQSGMND